MEDYIDAVEQVNKTETKNKTMSLLINIFLSVGMVLNILDNDLMRDIINSEYKFKRSVIISGINIGYSIVVLVVSNIYYFLQ